MRAIPDDVEPVPPLALQNTLADGGTVALDDAGQRLGELPHAEHPSGCVDTRHHVTRVRQIASDRFSVARSVIDLLWNEHKTQLSPQIDPVTGRVLGLTVDDVGDDSCLRAIGFHTGDFLRTVNGYELDLTAFPALKQSVLKDGSAVVRFDRNGHTMTVFYEVRNE
jgi:hypothetical protein